MSQVLELSIAETNKLRAELGLRPLDPPECEKPTQKSAIPEKRVYEGGSTDAKVTKLDVDDTSDNVRPIKGITNDDVDDMMKRGESIILTLADTNVLDDEGDLLTFGNKTKEELNDGDALELNKRVVKDIHTDRFEEDYGGLIKRLEPIGAVGTISTDDEYIRRQQSILSIAEQVATVQALKNPSDIASHISIQTAKKPLNVPDAPEYEVDMHRSKSKGSKDSYKVREMDDVTEFVQVVELPENVIADMTAEREVHERVAKAYRDDKLNKQKADNDILDDDDDMKLVRENDLGDGLASALEALKSRGKLDEKSKVAVIRGGVGTVDTVLERRDDFGNVMSVKEAFNQLSYKFHGKRPGLNKQERQLRKRMIEKEATDVTKLPTMRALHQNQKIQGQAYLSLQNTSRK